MIVTAMLNWFDEPPELLRQAVRSAAVIADRLVAADGAYELVEDKRPSSPRSQRQAIKDEAEKCGLKVEFLRPQIWSGQVAKRSACLQAAAPGSDWVMVIDADWKITGDREAIREELEQLLEADYDQVAVSFFQPVNEERSWQESAANEWHIKEADQRRQFPLIYRALPAMVYQQNHWSVFGVREDDTHVALFGGIGTPGYETPKTAYLGSDHLFEHMCLFREPKQIIRNREFISRRDEDTLLHGVER